MRIISLNYEQEDSCMQCKCEFAYNPKDLEFEETTGKYVVRCPNCTQKKYVEPEQWFIDKYNDYVKSLNRIKTRVDF